jgi:cephalosporin-C deacetylase-like acetyl esterase
MKTYIAILSIILVVVCNPFYCDCNNRIQPSASLPETTPWDLTALSESPSFEWIDKDAKIPSLKYKGLSYQNQKQTSVFAYYSTPGRVKGDRSLDRDLPALVLIHGGGGRAFKDWVEYWATNGYAAIAMDLAGCGLDGERLPDGGPNQTDKEKFSNIDKPVTEQWTYHAVANAILAHSLIRTFPEIDPDRIGVTGISWGGT